MENKFSGFTICFLLLALLSVCCKTDDPAEETFIPNISNTWIDVAKNNHTFNFNTTDVGVSRGSFTGFENVGDSALTFSLNGTFSNRNISFIVSRRGRDTTYNGRFTADTLIDFGALKIFRSRL